MPDPLAEPRRELAIANRILANEGVLDAFGHISMRHPKDDGRYLISRHRAAELVEPNDILEFTLDSEPAKPTDQRLYSELVIHGEVYRRRPDVHSVCHHHAVAVLPFCISGVALVPVMHLGASMGATVPFWDSRDEFGDTELLITKPEEGRSMAKAMGEQWMVLLRRHGATVAGHSLRECVFRSVYMCRNAELQSRAMAMGTLAPLTKGEIDKCAAHNLMPRTIGRAWEYWARRLEKAEHAAGGKAVHAVSLRTKPERPTPAKLIMRRVAAAVVPRGKARKRTGA
jgi:ribulose-5-phosphate 4-epimerase/fuculose-1-phosphate aldolase